MSNHKRQNPNCHNITSTMQFSTNEAVSLDKSIATKIKPAFTDAKDIDHHYEIKRCAEWIKRNDYKKVCLQFPDHLLPDSSAVALHLQEELRQTVYILGDTSYESCCLDYVAAAHIDADAIVHFGPVCFSQFTQEIPSLMIYEKRGADLEELKVKICGERFKGRRVIVLLDSEYIYLKERLEQILQGNPSISVYYLHNYYDAKNCCVIYIGSSNKKLIHLQATLGCDELFACDPQSGNGDIDRFEMDSRVVKRRYFLAEKIKDSTTVGIVVGTLAIKNYLRVVERMKKLLAAHRKKYYIISVGKLTVAKLANFSEIEVYVLISCSMNDVFESRDFYQPIVTPFDVEIALNNKPPDTPFSYDYNHYLDFSEAIAVSTDENKGDVSLITGRVRANEEEIGEVAGNQVALKDEGTVAVNAAFLNARTWKGLEQNLGQTEVKLAEEGRSGTAFSYSNELDL